MRIIRRPQLSDDWQLSLTRWGGAPVELAPGVRAEILRRVNRAKLIPRFEEFLGEYTARRNAPQLTLSRRRRVLRELHDASRRIYMMAERLEAGHPCESDLQLAFHKRVGRLPSYDLPALKMNVFSLEVACANAIAALASVPDRAGMDTRENARRELRRNIEAAIHREVGEPAASADVSAILGLLIRASGAGGDARFDRADKITSRR